MKYLYKSESYSIPQRLLFIPIKETVIFPYVIAPLFFQTDEAVVEELLGPRKFFREVAQERDRIGVVTGLAWTER